MSDPVEEFSLTLEALLSVKPPGVSGSKIRKLTELALENLQVNIPIIELCTFHTNNN